MISQSHISGAQVASGTPSDTIIQNICTITQSFSGQPVLNQTGKETHTHNYSFSLVTTLGVLNSGIRQGDTMDRALEWNRDVWIPRQAQPVPRPRQL